jgi:undecaprenyl diphosphate synthase
MNSITNTQNIPHHVAIIMDGNARWAKQNNKNRLAGYQKGIKVAQNIIRNVKEIGVEHLTLFAFSLENWQRPASDVKSLMTLLRQYLANDVEKLLAEGMQISFIGDLTKLDQDIREQMEFIAAESSKAGHQFKLRLAISYGARNEILRAAIFFAQKHYEEDFNWDIEKCEEKFVELLNPQNFPEPDLLIRTSGEHRLSNFLLWEMAYTELIFVEKLWPDFTADDLHAAIEVYSKRERRFGR